MSEQEQNLAKALAQSLRDALAQVDAFDPHLCTDHELCRYCLQCPACCGCY